MANQFAVIQIAHPAIRGVRHDCEDCLRLSQSAVAHARVTGSVGSTFANNDHACTVTRILKIVEEDR